MTDHLQAADELAERLDALLPPEGAPGADKGASFLLADSDPVVAVAERLANADHPVMSPEFHRVMEAQVRAAATRQTAGRARWYRQPVWALTASALLAVGLLAVLMLRPGMDPTLSAATATASTTSSPTPSATLSATPSPTITPTGTPSVTPTVTLTLTSSVTPTPIWTGTPLAVEGQDQALDGPVLDEPVVDETSNEAYNCENPPPDYAQASGWREHCEDGPPPNEVAPGQTDDRGNNRPDDNGQGANGQGNNGQSSGPGGGK